MKKYFLFFIYTLLFASSIFCEVTENNPLLVEFDDVNINIFDPSTSNIANHFSVNEISNDKFGCYKILSKPIFSNDRQKLFFLSYDNSQTRNIVITQLDVNSRNIELQYCNTLLPNQVITEFVLNSDNSEILAKFSIPNAYYDNTTTYVYGLFKIGNVNTLGVFATINQVGASSYGIFNSQNDVIIWSSHTVFRLIFDKEYNISSKQIFNNYINEYQTNNIALIYTLKDSIILIDNNGKMSIISYDGSLKNEYIVSKSSNYSFCVSPNEKYLALIKNSYHDNVIYIIDINSGHEVMQYYFGDIIKIKESTSVSEVLKYFSFFGDNDGVLCIFKNSNNYITLNLKLDEFIKGDSFNSQLIANYPYDYLEFSKDGKFLITHRKSSKEYIADEKTISLIWNVYNRSADPIKISGTAKYVGKSNSIIVISNQIKKFDIDLKNFHLINLKQSQATINSISSDNKYLITNIGVYDVEKEVMISKIAFKGALSEDNSTIAFEKSGKIFIQDFLTRKDLCNYTTGNKTITKLYLSPNGKICVTIDYDKILTIYDNEKSVKVDSYKANSNMIGFIISKDNKYLLYGKTLINIFDKTILSLPISSDIIKSYFTDSSKYLLICDKGKLIIYDLDNKNISKTIYNTLSEISYFTYSESKGIIAIGSSNGELIIYNLELK